MVKIKPLTWKPEYSVCIERIDEQHKRLMGMINSLIPFLKKPFDNSIGSILMRLVEFSREHFHTEEQLFKKYEYASRNEHKHYHDHFIAMVIKFLKEFQDRKTTLSREIYEFLMNWFDSHLLVEDRKYCTFFKEKGVQ